MLGAAGAAGWLLTMQIVGPAPAQPTATPQPSVAEAPAREQIHREGQVIAASGDSFTTSTPDGQTTTFRITPQTAQIALPAVKRHVVVVGVVHDGVAVATAIADQTAVGPDGPPMDYGLPT
jgi:thiamine biosynthesis lipoprotein ApbE